MHSRAKRIQTTHNQRKKRRYRNLSAQSGRIGALLYEPAERKIQVWNPETWKGKEEQLTCSWVSSKRREVENRAASPCLRKAEARYLAPATLCMICRSPARLRRGLGMIKWCNPPSDWSSSTSSSPKGRFALVPRGDQPTIPALRRGYRNQMTCNRDAIPIPVNPESKTSARTTHTAPSPEKKTEGITTIYVYQFYSRLLPPSSSSAGKTRDPQKDEASLDDRPAELRRASASPPSGPAAERRRQIYR